MRHSSYTSDEEVEKHGNRITAALIDASLDPMLIQEFLLTQTAVCLKINQFLDDGKEDLSEEELIQLNRGDYIRNEIQVINAIILADIIDISYRSDCIVDEEPLWERVLSNAVEIKSALKEATIDACEINDFLKKQIELFNEINVRHKEKFSKKEYEINKRKILNVSFLQKALE